MAVVLSEGPAISDWVIQKRAVVFSVNIGAFGVTRKLRSSQFEVDADKRLIRAQKVLLDCPEIRAIQHLDGEIRRYVESRALPGPLKRGLDLLPIELLDSTDAAMKSYQSTRQNELVPALGAVWHQRVAEAALELRSAFDRSDYPTWPEVERRYFFFWSYAHLANPDAMLPPEIAKRNAEQMEQMWRETALGIEELLNGSLLDLVAHLQERLAGVADNGKPKVFRDSSVTNIQDFLATFDARNLTKSAKLKETADKVKALLSSKDGKYYDPDVLRNSDKLREEVRQGFAAIKAELDKTITEAPKRRRFDFDN